VLGFVVVVQKAGMFSELNDVHKLNPGLQLFTPSYLGRRDMWRI
jgi:hypothetical protein